MRPFLKAQSIIRSFIRIILIMQYLVPKFINTHEQQDVNLRR